jgi:ATP-dependent DNA helicase RecG
MLSLNSSVDNIKSIGNKYLNILNSLDIYTIEELLYYIPYRYDDYSNKLDIKDLKDNQIATIKVQLKELKNIYLKNGKSIQKGIFYDSSASIIINWFNQPYLKNVFKFNEFYFIAGKVKIINNNFYLISPKYEKVIITNKSDNISGIHTGRLVPVYHQTIGLSSKWIRNKIYLAYKLIHKEIKEIYPQSIINENKLIPLKNAIYKIHFPKTILESQLARKRLIFDELFLIQLSALLRKKERDNIKTDKIYKSVCNKQINIFIKSLPFKLTPSQTESINEILKDLSRNISMNRLLQGDVGSGKTIVSIISAYAMYLSGYTSILLAPTTILAQQHFDTFKKLLNKFGVKIGLYTSQNKIQKNKKFDILICTHAILYKNDIISDAGLIIVDEQHRFGVEQRKIIKKIGNKCHFLSMTATPIPRTIALTLYQDLDLSLIKELPAKRKLPKTWVIPSYKKEKAYIWMKNRITEYKDQIYLICPFIEESEAVNDVHNIYDEYENLKNGPFEDISIAYLHGKMKKEEINSTLEKFKKNKISLLITTSLVEVGIDIPNANIIMIENSDRFGLAQLHQLRGRIGRSDKDSFCLLFTEIKDVNSIKRLKFLEKNSSGIKIAEFDYKIRGSGEIFGINQSGKSDLKIASYHDFNMIHISQQAVTKFFNNYKLNNFPLLQEKLQKYKISDITLD